jgi:SagB-type dehydrogenase family enzyme
MDITGLWAAPGFAIFFFNVVSPLLILGEGTGLRYRRQKMKNIKSQFPFLIITFLFLFLFCATGTVCGDEKRQDEYITLPAPKLTGELSLEECLAKRRSVRDYADQPLTLAQVSQLLWAAQGTTSEKGGRTAPSAGALYPLETYIVVTNVDSIEPGIYRYETKPHRLLKIKSGNFRDALCAAALSQKCIVNAPMTMVIAAEYERTRKKYKDRTERYVHMEVGCASQNIYLQAETLRLGTVAVGAFMDDEVQKVLGEKYLPLLLMPIGRKTQI